MSSWRLTQAGAGRRGGGGEVTPAVAERDVQGLAALAASLSCHQLAFWMRQSQARWRQPAGSSSNVLGNRLKSLITPERVREETTIKGGWG